MKSRRSPRSAPLRRGISLALPFLLVTLLAAHLAHAGDAQPPISTDQIKQTLEKLAGEDFLGREAGSEGGKAAGDWIAAECEKLGLKPAGDDGTYFQSFKASGKQMRNVVATLPAREGSELADEVLVIGCPLHRLGLDVHLFEEAEVIEPVNRFTNSGSVK